MVKKGSMLYVMSMGPINSYQSPYSNPNGGEEPSDIGTSAASHPNQSAQQLAANIIMSMPSGQIPSIYQSELASLPPAMQVQVLQQVMVGIDVPMNVQSILKQVCQGDTTTNVSTILAELAQQCHQLALSKQSGASGAIE